MASSASSSGPAGATDDGLSSWKVGDLKAELKKLGVSDLTKCLDKDDLVAELRAARKRAADDDAIDDGGLKYGEVAALGNTRDPTALMVIAHGLGDTCRGWTPTVPHFANRHKHVLFVLPTAPVQPVSLNMGMPMPSWYNIRSLSMDAAEDTDGMRRSARYIDGLVAKYAAQYGIAQDRVVYGGFSQGGCMALFTGLTTSRGTPAGICSMSGYLGSRQWVAQRLRHPGIPIFMAHGTQDPVVPFAMAQMSKAGLEANGVKNVELRTYPMGHSACEDELEHINAWLQKVIPAQ